MINKTITVLAIVSVLIGGTILPVYAGIDVEIDIKPGSDPNSINPQSRGVIPVAILTTDTFDAAAVNCDTLVFGPGGASPPSPGASAVKCNAEDVNDDGSLDLVAHFVQKDTGIACGDTYADLTGETFDGSQVYGTDSIRVVPCPRS